MGVRAGRWRDTRTNMWKRPGVGRVGGEPATDHLEPRALNLCVALPTVRMEMDAVRLASRLVRGLFRSNGGQPLTSL